MNKLIEEARSYLNEEASSTKNKEVSMYDDLKMFKSYEEGNKWAEKESKKTEESVGFKFISTDKDHKPGTIIVTFEKWFPEYKKMFIHNENGPAYIVIYNDKIIKQEYWIEGDDYIGKSRYEKALDKYNKPEPNYKLSSEKYPADSIAVEYVVRNLSDYIDTESVLSDNQTSVKNSIDILEDVLKKSMIKAGFKNWYKNFVDYKTKKLRSNPDTKLALLYDTQYGQYKPDDDSIKIFRIVTPEEFEKNYKRVELIDLDESPW